MDTELQDGRREPLSPETLTLRPNGGLYCLATRHKMKARFGKTAYYELTQYLRMDADGSRFYFTIKNRRYDIHPEG